VLAAAPALRSQDPRAVMEESLAKQRESIAKQKAAVRAQMAPSDPKSPAPPPPPEFYTVPWSQPIAALRPLCDPVSPAQIGPLVAEVSGREGLRPDLLRAVIEKESGYVPCAILSNYLGEINLADHDATLTEHNTSDLSDAEIYAHLRLSGVPALLFFRNGVEVARLTGLHSAEEIVETIELAKVVR
jgi:hypothetical protein